MKRIRVDMTHGKTPSIAHPPNLHVNRGRIAAGKGLRLPRAFLQSLKEIDDWMRRPGAAMRPRSFSLLHREKSLETGDEARFMPYSDAVSQTMNAPVSMQGEGTAKRQPQTVTIQVEHVNLNLQSLNFERLRAVKELSQISWGGYLSKGLEALTMLSAIAVLAEGLICMMEFLEENSANLPKSLPEFVADERGSFSHCEELPAPCLEVLERSFDLVPNLSASDALDAGPVNETREQVIHEFQSTINSLPPEERPHFVMTYLTTIGADQVRAFRSLGPTQQALSLQSVDVARSGRQIILPEKTDTDRVHNFVVESEDKLMARLAGVIIGGATYTGWQVARAMRSRHRPDARAILDFYRSEARGLLEQPASVQALKQLRNISQVSKV